MVMLIHQRVPLHCRKMHQVNIATQGPKHPPHCIEHLPSLDCSTWLHGFCLVFVFLCSPSWKAEPFFKVQSYSPDPFVAGSSSADHDAPLHFHGDQGLRAGRAPQGAISRPHRNRRQSVIFFWPPVAQILIREICTKQICQFKAYTGWIERGVPSQRATSNTHKLH